MGLGIIRSEPSEWFTFYSEHSKMLHNMDQLLPTNHHLLLFICIQRAQNKLLSIVGLPLLRNCWPKPITVLTSLNCQLYTMYFTFNLLFLLGLYDIVWRKIGPAWPVVKPRLINNWCGFEDDFVYLFCCTVKKKKTRRVVSSQYSALIVEPVHFFTRTIISNRTTESWKNEFQSNDWPTI